MTAPERLATYCGSIDRLRHRVSERNAALRSTTSLNTRAIASKMKITPVSHPYGSCSPLDPSRLAPEQPSHGCSAPIEIP